MPEESNRRYDEPSFSGEKPFTLDRMVDEHIKMLDVFDQWPVWAKDSSRGRLRMMVMIMLSQNGVIKEELNYGSGRCIKMPRNVRTEFTSIQ